jgi:hypothetical protein
MITPTVAGGKSTTKGAQRSTASEGARRAGATATGRRRFAAQCVPSALPRADGYGAEAAHNAQSDAHCDDRKGRAPRRGKCHRAAAGQHHCGRQLRGATVRIATPAVSVGTGRANDRNPRAATRTAAQTHNTPAMSMGPQ